MKKEKRVCNVPTTSASRTTRITTTLTTKKLNEYASKSRKGR